MGIIKDISLHLHNDDNVLNEVNVVVTCKWDP